VRKGEDRADLVMKRGKAEGKKTNERNGKKEEGEELPRIRT
jgi:hypothetical protein